MQARWPIAQLYLNRSLYFVFFLTSFGVLQITKSSNFSECKLLFFLWTIFGLRCQSLASSVALRILLMLRITK